MQTIKTVVKDPLQILDEQLLPPDKLGVYASADVLYKGTVFGRDALEVAEDLLDIRPDVVEGVLLKLASLQGVKNDPVTEEEPGKIHHEHRCLGDNEQGSRVVELFNELAGKWGGDDKELTYYGSVDATPLFVRLAIDYQLKYKLDLEKLEINHKDGHTTNLRQAVQSALEWLERKCTASETGLLEYKAANPRGLINQAWKDSSEFYIHSDGSRANHRLPIASIEVQAYAYDAFKLGELTFPDKATDYAKLRRRIQRQVVEILWMEDEEYFALGYDYESAGRPPRPLEVLTANPGSLLDSAILEDLGEKESKKYLTGIIKHIFSGDFLTAAGIRSRALRHADLVPIWDYHGSFVTWPKETYDIARGLRRHGLIKLSEQLENRLLNLFGSTKAYPEFVYVDEEGNVLFNIGPPRGSTTLPGTNHPENPQAWTVSAAAAILNSPSAFSDKQPTWKTNLEKDILNQIPLVTSVLEKGSELLLAPFKLFKTPID